MKKITFLVAGLFLVLNAAVAQETERGRGPRVEYHNSYAIDYREAEPIVFRERGIEFFVFPTGDFDFNTVINGPRPRRGSINETYGAPRVEDRGIRGVRIEHDSYGRVRRVGNVFINYDYYGRVKRIGSVYMTYNSFALTRIGGMRIFYNYHSEIIGVSGFVNGYGGYAYNPCPAGYNGGGHDYDEDWYEDEGDFYFYKKDGTKEKMKKEDVDAIKREAVERKS